VSLLSGVEPVPETPRLREGVGGRMTEVMQRDPRPGSQKPVSRLVLAIATALVGIVTLEAFSCAALRASEGRWIGLSDLEAARAHTADGARGDALRRIAERVEPIREERILHPYLGYVMDPRITRPGIAQAGLDALSVELGFPRNREPVLQAADPARAVIGIFGGSVADILSIFGADALRLALARAPALRGREIVLLSLAAPGYKQPQALMGLNYVLVLGGHFDAVVNLDGVNDLALPESELSPLGVAPFYPRGWYTRTADLTPSLQLALVSATRAESLRRRSAYLFSRAPLRWSHTAGLVWRLGDRLLAARLAESESVLLTRPSGHSPQAQGPRLARDSDVQSRAVSVWEKSSLQMARLCQGLGIPYFHFLQPNQYVPGEKPMGEAERRLAIREDSPVRGPIEHGYARLREAGAALAAEGVAFSDLSGVFRDVADPVYVDDCCHLNERGNRLLAEAIGRIMASAPALATTR
jgi:hypothetical protein